MSLLDDVKGMGLELVRHTDKEYEMGIRVRCYNCDSPIGEEGSDHEGDCLNDCGNSTYNFIAKRLSAMGGKMEDLKKVVK